MKTYVKITIFLLSIISIGCTSKISHTPTSHFYRKVDLGSRMEFRAFYPVDDADSDKVNCYHIIYDSQKRISRIDYRCGGKPHKDKYFKLASIKVQYNGLDEQRSFYNVCGLACKNEDGIYSIRISKNKLNVPVRAVYLDQANQPMNDNSQICYTNYLTNTDGQVIQKKFYNILHNSLFLFRKYNLFYFNKLALRYDEFGNTTSEKYINLNGDVVYHRSYICDSNGNPMISSRVCGLNYIRNQYDKYGNLIQESFYEYPENRTNLYDDFNAEAKEKAKTVYQYNYNGNCTTAINYYQDTTMDVNSYDTQSNLIKSIKFKFAKGKFKRTNEINLLSYDKNNNLLIDKRTYINFDNTLDTYSDTTLYDEKCNLIYKTDFPQIRYTYDIKNRVAQMICYYENRPSTNTYTDLNHFPEDPFELTLDINLSSANTTSYVYYRQKTISYSYFLSSSLQNNIMVRSEINQLNQVTEQRFYNKKQLIENDFGIAIIKYYYDRIGLLSYIRMYNSKGQPAEFKGKNVSIIRYKYKMIPTNANNYQYIPIMTSYYDQKGNLKQFMVPVIGKSGIVEDDWYDSHSRLIQKVNQRIMTM